MLSAPNNRGRGRDALAVWRYGRGETVSARGAHPAWSSGPASPLGGSSACRAQASSAKIRPIELWRCDMKDRGSGGVRLSEALALWLPGADGIFIGRSAHVSSSSDPLVPGNDDDCGTGRDRARSAVAATPQD